VWVLLSVAALLIVSFLAVSMGPVKVPLSMVVGIFAEALGLAKSSANDAARLIVLDVRFPRVVMGMLVGSLLAVSGAATQAIFRNPLAEPSIIGVSSGGAVGASLWIALGHASENSGVFGMAFVGALSAALFVYAISSTRGHTPIVRLLLAGLAVTTLLNAFASLILSLVVPDWKLGSTIVLWLMGSVADADWGKIGVLGGALVIVGPLIWANSARLNVMMLGEEQAESLGVHAKRLRLYTLALVALGTGAAVAASGIIGFVGLVVPLSVRIAVGPDLKRVVPLSLLVGGAFVLVVDSLCRTILAPMEIRLGIMSAAVGAPVFLVILLRSVGFRG
jgi:iron complex transport system permease protein